MSRLQSVLPTLFAVTALTFSFQSVSAAEKAAMTDLNDYLCKDVMRLSGVDRQVSIALVHGYRLGKKGTTDFDTQALSEITDEYMEHCLDNPNDKALAAFEKIAK
jgi:hypothetical protein